MQGAARTLWTVRVGTGCSGPQRLLRVDPATGSTRSVAALRAGLPACQQEQENDQQLAAVGERLFLLDPGLTPTTSLLHRIDT